MSEQGKDLPPEFLERIRQVTNKRARIVLDHILQYGYITTEELKEKYGYNHPPRAAKDVRDEGIPLETFSVKSSDGRTIAAYRFGDLLSVVEGRSGGRKTFPKRFKNVLYKQAGGKCEICGAEFSGRELQVDHRVPYEIGGDAEFSEANTSGYMLVCGSCNRSKSWSCEHCPNWITKLPSLCQSCYWAHPDNYLHVATRNVRRVDMVWEGEELETFEEIRVSAQKANVGVSQFIKLLLQRIIHRLSTFLSLLSIK